MKSLVASIICIFSFTGVFAQVESYTADVLETGINPSSYGGVMIGKKLPPAGVEGDPYLFEDYRQGDIILSNDKMLKDAVFNIDLFNDIFIVKRGDELFSLGFNNVKAFVATGITYETTKVGEDLSVSRVLYKGDKVSLFSVNELSIKEPTYIEGADVGNRNTKIFKKENLYIFIDGKMMELKKKKDLEEAFRGNKEMLAKLDDRKIKPKDTGELVKLLNEMNY